MATARRKRTVRAAARLASTVSARSATAMGSGSTRRQQSRISATERRKGGSMMPRNSPAGMAKWL